MKIYIQALLLVSFLSFSFSAQSQQTRKELMDLKATKVGALEDHLAQATAIENELELIDSQLSLLAGWRKGISGTVGFDLDRATRWISNPNPNSKSSSLSLGVTGYLKNDKEKTFWHNNASVQKAWRSLDLDTKDGVESGGIFSSSTVDVVNISSLAGYRITDKLAVSALGELYSSIDKITDQGTVDFGVGITWLPLSNLTVTVLPLNYHFLYTNKSWISSEGALGAKVKVDYNVKFKLFANDCTWQSSLFGFFPYNDSKLDIKNDLANPDLVVFQSSLAEYTWLNTLSLELWKGIGLGAGWGLRKSGFEAFEAEAPKLQSFFNFGISFTY